jgi:hypothetical protein
MTNNKFDRMLEGSNCDLVCTSFVTAWNSTAVMVWPSRCRPRDKVAACRDRQQNNSISWDKINIKGRDSNGHCEKKKVHTNMCPILNGYCDRAVWISRPKPISYLFVGLYEEQMLQKKGGYMRWTAHSHFGCSCLHTEMWRSPQMNNTQLSHTHCKVLSHIIFTSTAHFYERQHYLVSIIPTFKLLEVMLKEARSTDNFHHWPLARQ